jgi:hydroxymethylglutaryl-CoA synthase
MSGIVAYGSYLPYWRLEKSAIGVALDTAPSKGVRSVAGFDEDTTSMGVEAGRAALVGAPDGYVPDVVAFATANPAYLDKTNATTIHAALGMAESVAAYDFVGAVRSAAGAMRLAQSSSLATLVVSSEIRTGLPSSAEEANSGDGAVAFAFSPAGTPLVEVVAETSATAEFLDRWRTPGADASTVWEERFGEGAYLTLAEHALSQLVPHVIQPEAVDHLVVAGLHSRAVRRVVASSGVPKDKVASDLSEQIGNTGTAQAGLALANVLDRAAAGEVIVVMTVADGVDVTVYRTTTELEQYRHRRASTLETQLGASSGNVSYASFLNWRGLLDREPPRRPDPASPAGPASLRHEHWKFGFTGSRCQACSTRHLPPSRVCHHCHATDQMTEERVADGLGTIATYTVDRLAFSPSPPLIAAVVDFDGGGRFPCEMTDVSPDEMEIGLRVNLTFRRFFTAPTGVHNYFWKARPVREEE